MEVGAEKGFCPRGGDREIILKWMITFYMGAIEARDVEHSNYKFSLDKTLSILFK